MEKIKFTVDRASERNNDISPCENAFKEGDEWFVELTMIELLEFIKQHSKVIILSSHTNPSTFYLTIYDYYVE